MQKNVVFLDRDGVINRDSRDYIKTPGDFQFLPRAREAVGALTRGGFAVIVITNQSIINRGWAPREVLESIHQRMKSGCAGMGGEISDIFHCPHTPDEGCACRKPKPGLIFQARDKHDVDLSASIMVGDSAKDIACAKNAGCGQSVLVKSGLEFEKQRALLEENGTPPDHVAADLYEAAQWILTTRPRQAT
ncbi:MAG: D-glycero-beta-D-manno-heptose 1,7-bisphosphate 7-phosphatase [Desulfobacterales bacterium]|nr:D-glycero-beta-D-manno-heptose 1,7-bisphosphate 7-phosphatase [Desulfobacterales bacterium]